MINHARQSRQSRFQEWENVVLSTGLNPVQKGSWWYFGGHQRPLDQGFKLHVSATLNNACAVFIACLPVLKRSGVHFKTVHNLGVLTQLNTGLLHGYSQIGKFITVYPESPEEAVALAGQLDEATRQFEVPAVPYDLKYRLGSAVHYRYGAFEEKEMIDDQGQKVLAIVDPDGHLVPDSRGPNGAIPHWVKNPFPLLPKQNQVPPFGTELLVYEVLSQRGKGGVYRAIELRNDVPRECILKEGRYLGEQDWNGSDGRASILKEAKVLKQLEQTGVDCPKLYWTFEAERNSYLVMEKLEGECLAHRLSNPRRKLPLPFALRVAWNLSRLMESIHDAGWVWRDCKPLNLMMTSDGSLRPIDFEGAVPTAEPTSVPYGTASYVPPDVYLRMYAEYDERIEVADVTSNLPQDLYALGATLYQIFTSHIEIIEKRPIVEGVGHLKFPPLRSKRRKVPREVVQIVDRLMSHDPQERPSAREVSRQLAMLLETTRPLAEAVLA